MYSNNWVDNVNWPPFKSLYSAIHIYLSTQSDKTKLSYFIILQSKSERSDWFFLGRDFAIRTVSVETVLSCVFFVFESRQIQHKHSPNGI